MRLFTSLTRFVRIIAFTFCLSLLVSCAQHHIVPNAIHSPAQVQVIDEKALETSSLDWERILPIARDLKADGRIAIASKKPILLFFNLSHCHFCRYALRTAVIPMYRDTAWHEAISILQITIDDKGGLLDFDGKSMTNTDFAKVRKVNFTPTIMVVDGVGKLLGEPIVGLANAEFYSAYVEALARHAIETMRLRE